VFQVGPPKELYERPANRFVADFIGINNLVDGTVRSANGALVVETRLGTLRALPDARFKPGDPCVLSVRPENASISDAHENRIPGKIAFAAYLGNTLRYDVDLGGGTVFKADVRDPWHHKQLALGSAVAVGFAAASTVAIPAA
jgi:ABC-type Fe3+/spermidine/putrescine transport system ATPase subunit